LSDSSPETIATGILTFASMIGKLDELSLEKAMVRLITLVQYPDAQVRESAVAALQRIDHPQAKQAVVGYKAQKARSSRAGDTLPPIKQ
jgi:hypothetical protein